MEQRTFGKTGLKVSLLGFGGAEIGYQGAKPETVTELLNSALDAGLNVIDTAECYANSEELIGAAVSHRRKDFHLFTKVGHEHGMGGGADWSKESIARTIERSLAHLKTEVLDLVQLHSCDEDTLKKGECIEALELAKQQGKTRFIGYSGDRAAAKYAVECGRFDTLQTSVSIADQEALDLTLPLAKEKNMGVIAKRPIANAAWRYETIQGNEYHAEYWRRLKKLDYEFLRPEPVEKDGRRALAASPAAIALRFTAFLTESGASTGGVHTLIVGTTNPKRWQENAGLLAHGPLPADLMKTIRDRWKEVSKGEWPGQT